MRVGTERRVKNTPRPVVLPIEDRVAGSMPGDRAGAGAPARLIAKTRRRAMTPVATVRGRSWTPVRLGVSLHLWHKVPNRQAQDQGRGRQFPPHGATRGAKP